MYKNCFFILIILAIAQSKSLYTDCYIGEQNLFSLADGDLIYDNYSNVLHLQN